jgi:hypothetical protein
MAPGASVQLTTPFYVVTAPLKRGQVMVGRVTPVWGGGTLPQTVGAQDPDPVLSVYGAPHSLQQDGGGVLPQRSSLNIISPLIVFDDSLARAILRLGPHRTSRVIRPLSRRRWRTTRRSSRRLPMSIARRSRAARRRQGRPARGSADNTPLSASLSGAMGRC